MTPSASTTNAVAVVNKRRQPVSSEGQKIELKAPRQNMYEPM